MRHYLLWLLIFIYGTFLYSSLPMTIFVYFPGLWWLSQWDVAGNINLIFYDRNKYTYQSNIHKIFIFCPFLQLNCELLASNTVIFVKVQMQPALIYGYHRSKQSETFGFDFLNFEIFFTISPLGLQFSVYFLIFSFFRYFLIEYTIKKVYLEILHMEL